MGRIVGHILTGIMVSSLGLWHLFNHIRLFSLRPGSYVAPVWFPGQRVRYLEFIAFIAAGVNGIASEIVFVVTSNLDVDGSLPPARLANFEHAFLDAALILYGCSLLLLERVRARGRRTLGMLLLAVIFAQELLMFHFHSNDHVGVEGQFHWFVQVISASCLATALIGAVVPRSFAVSLIRSISLTLQGVWFLVTSTMWVPRFVAKGCSLEDDGITVSVHCHSDDSLHRAKAIVNLLFGWCLSLVSLFVVALYLYVCHKYPTEDEAAYGQVPEAEEDDDLMDHKCDQCTSLDIEV